MYNEAIIFRNRTASKMNDTNMSSSVIYELKMENHKINNDYHIDLWREIRKRWMILGVLVSVLLATLNPHFGAPGGLLHTEYLSYIPQSYIYYSSGRRSKIQIWGLRENARLYAISCLHVHLVGPALGVVLVSSLDFGLDYRLVKGIILSCVGGPCSWLSLALCTSDYAASVVALNYLSTFIAEPLAMIVLCGRATVPPLGGIISTFLTTATPFLIGATVKRYSGDSCATKLCACLLAYMSCCQLLAKSGGLLTTHYVLVTIVIEFCWLVMSAGTCWLYVRCGLLKQEHFQTLAMCSIPKSLEYGWQSSCRPPGLSSLPSVFLAPAQAILLAAMAGDDDDEYAFGDDNDGDEQRQISMQ